MDVNEVDKTATEAKIAKKRKFNRVVGDTVQLKGLFRDLVYALAFYNGLYKNSVMNFHTTQRLVCR